MAMAKRDRQRVDIIRQSGWSEVHYEHTMADTPLVRGVFSLSKGSVDIIADQRMSAKTSMGNK